MKKSIYINGLGSISSQKTYDNTHFLNEVIHYNNTVLPAVSPNYKDYIVPSKARRMANGVKMGITAAKIALKNANHPTINAIITGTGMGCIIDTEKFVGSIIDNDEQYLTPTPFIQSTHNTVGGQIAIDINCKGYNFTYVQASNSFESALLDASLQLELNEAETILVGGIDELSDHSIKIHKKINHIKNAATASNQLLNSTTKGAIFGEGANFFVLSNKRQDSTYAKLLGTSMHNTLKKEHLNEVLIAFLSAHNLTLENLDSVVLGYNGDVEFDSFYNTFTSLLKAHTGILYYKLLIGEYHTASAFALYTASQLIRHQQTPEDIIKRKSLKTKQSIILLYNQYRGEHHSFTLLKSCE